MATLIKLADWSGKRCGHVVFVHGLGGHAYDTWGRLAEGDSFWPLWLGRDIKGLAVWTVSYASPPTNWLGTSLPLQDRAVTVLEALLSEPDLEDGSIAFVCHSLGGLVVKQTLREANDQKPHRSDARRLLDRVRAVVFIATPHSGSSHATWLDRLSLLAWPSTAAQDLIRNDPNLRNLNVWYRNWAGGIAHRIFYETHGTAAGTIVDPASADAGLPSVVPTPVEADHVAICKLTSRDQLVYRGTRDFLAREVFDESDSGTLAADFRMAVRPVVEISRPNRWFPVSLRLAVLLAFVVISVKGVEALFSPAIELDQASVQQIEDALLARQPALTQEQLDQFIEALRDLGGVTSFEDAVAEAQKGNTHVAIGIWRQIYEDRKSQRATATAEQATAARRLAATVVTDDVLEGLRWYREATSLEPENTEGLLGLGDAALAAGSTGEAARAFGGFLALATEAHDGRAVALGQNRLGDVLVQQGNFDDARERYETALAVENRALEDDPENAVWKHNLASTHHRIGEVHESRGDFDAALESHKSALAVLQTLTTADRDRAWLLFVAFTYANIGDAELNLGNFDLAIEHYVANLAIVQELAAADPAHTTTQTALGVAHERIGMARAQLGDFDGALESHGISLGVGERLAADDPGNAEAQRNVAVSHLEIGDIKRARENWDSALESYESALAIVQRLTTADPQNKLWELDLAETHERIGDVRFGQGNTDEALATYEVCLAIFERMSAMDPGNLHLLRNLSFSRRRIGDVQRSQGDLDAALSSYSSALRIAERVAAGSANLRWQRDVGIIHNEIGNLFEARRDTADAITAYERSLSIAQALAARFPDEQVLEGDVEFAARRLSELRSRVQ